MSKQCIKQFNVLYSIPPKITYSKLFWLYIAGSLAGTGLEGVFCVFKYGHWETHVVSLLGPFCIIYGIGAVGCYVGYTILYRKSKWIQFTLYVLMGFSLELLCGLLLEFGLSMRAWNYSNHIFNIRGHVSLQMSLVWGIVGMAFSVIVPYIEVVLSKAEKKDLEGWLRHIHSNYGCRYTFDLCGNLPMERSAFRHSFFKCIGADN